MPQATSTVSHARLASLDLHPKVTHPVIHANLVQIPQLSAGLKRTGVRKKNVFSLDLVCQVLSTAAFSLLLSSALLLHPQAP